MRVDNGTARLPRNCTAEQRTIGQEPCLPAGDGGGRGMVRGWVGVLTLVALGGTTGSVLASPAAALTVETVKYKGWPDCVHISNGQVEFIATTVIGPRLIRLGFVGGANEFHEFPSDAGKTGGTVWRSYGGHRLWHAPEANPR